MTELDKIGFYTLSNERARNTSPTSQMKRGEIIINEYCNFKCPYCKGLNDDIFGDRKRKELSFEEIKEIIDLWCYNQPIENIRFSGGEPTFHKNIIDIVKYAKDSGINRIAISTNGSNKTKLYENLIDSGVNDFSVSLDAADEETGDRMAGNIKGSWKKVVDNIEFISSRTYVTCGVVLEPGNVTNFIDIVKFASSLGVSDIRVIPSAQWNQPLDELRNIPDSVLDKHPILRYRVKNFVEGNHIRGLKYSDTNKCPLVLDDSAIAGRYHYSCVIYMREQGNPIGEVNSNMRNDRIEWFKNHDSQKDPICKKNCLDACIDYNNRVISENEIVKELLN